MTHRPSQTLVVDANIILSAILGRRSFRIVADVVVHRKLAVPEHVLDEVRLVLSRIERRPNVALADVLIGVETVPLASYEAYLHLTASTLRNAVASRNGSVADAHLLALAWLLEADIWSHDRDFAGTGWPSWSSANLVAALDDLVTPLPDC